MKVRDVFGKERFLRTPRSTAGSHADVVADRPGGEMSEAAQARFAAGVRSPRGWTSARGCATVRIKKRAKDIERAQGTAHKAPAGCVLGSVAKLSVLRGNAMKRFSNTGPSFNYRHPRSVDATPNQAEAVRQSQSRDATLISAPRTKLVPISRAPHAVRSGSRRRSPDP
jgi:hypothetical protein